MSLDDKFNPNDGSAIDRVDHTLYQASTWVASQWQDHTHRDKELLIKGLYMGSAAVLSMNAFSEFGYVSIPFAVFNMIRAVYKPLRPKSGLHDEMYGEMLMNDPKMIKKWNCVVTSIAALAFAGTAYSLGYAACTSTGPSISLTAHLFSIGMGYTMWMMANYISRSDIGKPPKKPKRVPLAERIWQKIGDIIPGPILQPEPVPLTLGMYDME